MNKIEDNIQWNPGYEGKEQFVGYEKKWFCNENKIIHPTLKSFLNCKDCVKETDKVEYEELQRKFFSSFHTIRDTIPTEVLCRSYNVKLTYFRPWL